MKQARTISGFFLTYNTIIIFVVLVVASSFLSDVFFTERNIFNLLRQVTPNGIVSMGMLLIILTGGIDLSVGAVLALASVLSALLAEDLGLTLALSVSIGAGAAVGVFHGVLVAWRNMAPFVVTLAGMTIARGLAYIFSKAAPIPIPNDAAFLRDFSVNYTLGLPNPVLAMLAVFLLTWGVLRLTSFGRLVVAIGSNETAVKLAGIRTGWYKFWVYVIGGAFCGIAGIISTTRTNVGSANVGISLELDSIAAVVIGGASLNGGRGSALNTMIGVLVLGLIGNIMNLMDVPAYPQQVIKGVIIVAAVFMQTLKKEA